MAFILYCCIFPSFQVVKQFWSKQAYQLCWTCHRVGLNIKAITWTWIKSLSNNCWVPSFLTILSQVTWFQIDPEFTASNKCGIMLYATFRLLLLLLLLLFNPWHGPPCGQYFSFEILILTKALYVIYSYAHHILFY